MMWKRLLSASLAFGLTAAAPPALAQTACGSYERLTGELKAKYGEKVSGRGLQSATSLIELWRSSETGSWTMLVIVPNGTTCVVVTGTDWMEETAVDADANI